MKKIQDRIKGQKKTNIFTTVKWKQKKKLQCASQIFNYPNIMPEVFKIDKRIVGCYVFHYFAD